MKLHNKAWEDVSVIILGKTPLLSMEIEQSIAEANPFLEVGTESFEKYEDALDYCKEKMNVGVIFIEDVDQPDFLLKDYYQNLSSYFKKSGWPCIGRIFYKDNLSQKSFNDIIELGSSVKHVNTETFKELSSCQKYLELTWEAFYNNIRNTVLPSAIEDTIVSILKFSKQEEDVFFTEGISRLITDELNINWFDKLAIDISYKIGSIDKDNSILKANRYLQEISSITNFEAEALGIESILKSTVPLTQKVPLLSKELNKLRKENRLEESLELISSTRTFRSSSVHKIVAKKKDNILNAIQNVYSLNKKVA